MPVGTVPVGTKVKVTTKYVKSICYHVITKELTDMQPDDVLTIRIIQHYPKETYPTFWFDEIKRPLNGLFLEVVPE